MQLNYSWITKVKFTRVYQFNPNIFLNNILAGFIGALGSLNNKFSNTKVMQSGLYLVSSFLEEAIVSSIEIHVQKIGKLSIMVWYSDQILYCILFI